MPSQGSTAAYDVVASMLKRVRHEEGRTWDVLLYQAAAGQGTSGEPIQSFPFGRDEPIEGLARDIVSYAEEEAESFEGGPSRVSFVAVVKGHEPLLRRQFTLSLDDREEGEGDMFDEAMNPSSKSIISELLLHNRLMMKTMLSSQLNIQAMQEREMRRKDERLDGYERRHFEQVRLVEDLHDGRAKRELEAKAEEASQRRKDEMMEQIMPALTVGVHHLFGRKILGGGLGPGGGGPATTLELMVQKLVESITPEQLMALQSSLSGTQQLTLMEIMKTVSDAEEARKQAAAAAEAARAAEANGAADHDGGGKST